MISNFYIDLQCTTDNMYKHKYEAVNNNKEPVLAAACQHYGLKEMEVRTLE